MVFNFNQKGAKVTKKKIARLPGHKGLEFYNLSGLLLLIQLKGKT
jgi:hypothetical protein